MLHGTLAYGTNTKSNLEQAKSECKFLEVTGALAF